MKLRFVFLLLLLSSVSAHSEQVDWQKCLDLPEFKLSSSLHLDSRGSAAMKGCELRVEHSDTLSRAYVFDVCNEDISLKHYPTLQESTFKFYRASSANCAFPMFGADFGVDPDHIQPYEEAKNTILRVITAIDKTHNTKDNKESPKGRVAIEQVACLQKLATEYLLNCVSFEGSSPNKKDTFLRRPDYSPAINTEGNKGDGGIRPGTILQKKVN
jgi:hypothetical protein